MCRPNGSVMGVVVFTISLVFIHRDRGLALAMEQPRKNKPEPRPANAWQQEAASAVEPAEILRSVLHSAMSEMGH